MDRKPVISIWIWFVGQSWLKRNAISIIVKYSVIKWGGVGDIEWSGKENLCGNFLRKLEDAKEGFEVKKLFGGT